MSRDIHSLTTPNLENPRPRATVPDLELGPEGPQASIPQSIDHFKVTRLVGSGGMGEVYLARDTKLGRRVALKLIRRELVGSDSAVERFLFEARATASFNHPHIVTVYAVGEHEGRPYLALEFLEGESLRARMRAEPPALKEALRIALAIAEALREAHARNILHRDLKPENVVIPRDGRLRVVDFGLAKVWTAKETASVSTIRSFAPAARTPGKNVSTGGSLTPEQRRPGGKSPTSPESRICGTPRYMAPEQWTGAEVDDRADVWALGLILYELLAQRLPYESQSPAALAMAVTDAQAVPAVDRDRPLPPAVTELVGRCLNKVASLRPSAAKIVDELSDLLASTRTRSPGEESPFRGLRAFTEQHADLFFGRDEEVALCLERIRNEPVLAVVGPSGAGKSSLVRAGLIPRLQEQGRWTILHVRPGNEPFAALAARLIAGQSAMLTRSSGSQSAKVPAEEPRLAAALRDSPGLLSLQLEKHAEASSTKVLLFVDQLEELHTLVPDADICKRFMEAICSAADDPASPVRVVMALRDDYLGKLAQGPHAREALSHVTVLRTPGSEALEEILTSPLEAVGYRYDDASLAADMVRSVGGEPSALPLLQFTCRTLWESRDRERRLLLRSRYDALGGVPGALATHADAVLGAISDHELRLAKVILLRMVTAEGTRRLITRDRLLEGLDAKASGVLDRLTESRLINTRRSREVPQTELELAHESLIWTWDRLARWIEESREELALLAELNQAAELWAKRGSRDDEVWRGDALRDAERKLDQLSTPIPDEARRFLTASRAAEEGELRRRRRLRLGGVGALASVAVLSAVFAVSFGAQKREAERQREVAEERELAAERERRVADVKRAEALAENVRIDLFRWDYFAARAKIRSSLELSDTALGRMHWTPLHDHPFLGWAAICEQILDVAFVAGGRTAAAGCTDGRAYLVDTTTGSYRVLRGNDVAVTGLAAAPDGTRIATALDSGTVLLWDLQAATFVPLEGHTSRVTGVDFNHDGSLLASGGRDRTARIWDVGSASERARLEGHTDRIIEVAFSPDGRRLATTGFDNTARVWDVASAETVSVLEGHSHDVLGIDFAPDGRLATSSKDTSIRIWDPTSGKQLERLDDHAYAVHRVRFNHDGSLLVSADANLWLFVWDAAKGTKLTQFPGTSFPQDVELAPTGNLMALAGKDGFLRLWDIDRRLPQDYHIEAKKVRASEPFTDIAISRDGKLVAVSGRDKKFKIYDAETGALVQWETQRSGLLSIDFGRGETIATGTDDGLVMVWNARTGAALQTMRGHEKAVVKVRFSPSGDELATASGDNTMRLWNVETGAVKRVFSGHQGPVVDVRFSPDGRRLASASVDQTIRLWSIAGGSNTEVLRGHTAMVSGLAFDRDGQRLASTGSDGTLRLWDLRTRRSTTIATHDGKLSRPWIDPEQRRVGAQVDDSTYRLWDLETGAETLFADGVRAFATTVVSRDGKRAVTSPAVATVNVWDMESQRRRWRAPVLLEHPPRLFSHNGWTDLDENQSTLLSSSWREAVERRTRLGSPSDDGVGLCLATFEDTVERWNIEKDTKVLDTQLAGVSRILAVPGGCLALGSDGATLVAADGRRTVLVAGASAIAWVGGEILTADAEGVRSFAADGAPRESYPVPGRATAVLRAGDSLVLGFGDGKIERYIIGAESSGNATYYEDLVTQRVTRMIEGPHGTLIVGSESGEVRTWTLETGKLALSQANLHGPVAHLAIVGDKLLMASAVGDHRVASVAVLQQDYCDLMRAIWHSVPIVWDGRPVERAPAPDHQCAQ